MSFLEYLERSKLQRLLDFYNLEEISWQLQNKLFTQELVPLTVKPMGTLKDHFQDQYKFSMKIFNLEGGTYRLVKQFPEFKCAANQFLYFEDDVLQFFELTNLVLPKHVFTGRQILVNTNLKPQALGEITAPGYYLIKVIPGSQRQDLNKYLSTLNPLEWEEKSHLAFGLKTLFIKKDSFEKVQRVLNQRTHYLKIQFPDIRTNKRLTLTSEFNRGIEMMSIYNLPNLPLTSSKSTLYIKALLTHFPKDTTPDEFTKDLKRIQSYEYHLEKFIRQLAYLYNKAQRAKL